MRRWQRKCEGNKEIHGGMRQGMTEKSGRPENKDSLCGRKGDHGLPFDAPWVVKQKMQMYRPEEPDVSFDAPWVVKHHGLTLRRTRPDVEADKA